MKLQFIIVALMLLFPAVGFAQNPNPDQMEGAYNYNERSVRLKKPLQYPYLREADEMWATVTWEIIDLRERSNQTIYYPTSPLGDRKSLMDVLMEGVNSGIQVYYPDDENNEFSAPIDTLEIASRLGATEQNTKVQFGPNPEDVRDTVIYLEALTSNVKQYIIKERWYFDKQRSELGVRIIGICPIAHLPSENLGIGKKKVFWARYSDFRKILATNEVYNRFNSAQGISFDNYFNLRLFSGYVIKEANPNNNRRIDEYKSGRDAIIEAENVKQSIFKFEHDLWEF